VCDQPIANENTVKRVNDKTKSWYLIKLAIKNNNILLQKDI
jgi:hypothetical protein